MKFFKIASRIFIICFVINCIAVIIIGLILCLFLKINEAPLWFINYAGITLSFLITSGLLFLLSYLRIIYKSVKKFILTGDFY